MVARSAEMNIERVATKHIEV